MKRFLRNLCLVLVSAAAISATAGCIVVPGGGPYYHDHDHDRYWQR